MHLHSYSLSLKLPNNNIITIVAPISEHIEWSIKTISPQNIRSSIYLYKYDHHSYLAQKSGEKF